jgi:chromosome segregation ATPase
MAEAILVSVAVGGATNLLTGLVKPLLSSVRTAVRCQAECGKLEVQIESIQSDVQHIRDQLEELERYDQHARQDLKLVIESLEKLGEELQLASIEVHRCNSASRLRIRLFDYRLAKKIMAHDVKVTEQAQALVPVNAHLTTILNEARAKCPSSEWQKWNREKNDILLREESTRLQEQYLLHSTGLHSSNSGPAEYSSQHSSHHMNHPDHPPQYHRSNTTPY